MRTFLVFLALLFVACSTDVEITPDLSGGSSSSGGPGDEACAACSAKNGSRLVLRPRSVSSPDGMVMPAGFTIRDEQRHEDCLPVRAEDGAMRCLPMPAVGATGFSGSTCSQKVALFVPSQLCGLVPKYVGESIKPADSCGDDLVAVYETGLPHAGKIFHLDNGSCVDVTSSYVGYVAHAVGPKVAASEFALVEIHE